MPAKVLNTEERLRRLERVFSQLGRAHLELEKKYLALVKLLFEIQPSPFVQHQREMLARQLAIKEQS
jgi:hypothetical protein